VADTPWTDQALLAALANREGSLLPAWRLYLPKKWTDDTKRCKAAGVPRTVSFATKDALAWAQIETALAAGIPRGTVLADAGYGD
jgi:SRSO17 transposase